MERRISVEKPSTRKWENYNETTLEPQENIPKIFTNYYDRTGNEKIPEPRIKHTKKVGSTKYHLLCWDSDNVYWEKDKAFSLEGQETVNEAEGFKCQTQKVHINIFQLTHCRWDSSIFTQVYVCVNASLVI